MEREGSPVGWKAKGRQKRRILKDEASRTEHHWRVELHRRRFSVAIDELSIAFTTLSVAVELQLADEA